MDGEHRYEINLKKDGLFINLSSDDVYFISKQMDKWFRILLDDSYIPVSLARPQAAPEPAPIQHPVMEAPQPAAPVDLPPVYQQPAHQPMPVQHPAQPVPQPVAEAPQPQLQQAQPVQPAPQPVYEQPVPQPVFEQPAPQPVAAQAQPVVQPMPPMSDVQLPLSQPAPQPVYEQLAPQPVAPQPMQDPAFVQAPPATAYQQPVMQTVPQTEPMAEQPEPLDPSVKDDFEAMMDSLMKDFETDEAGPQTMTMLTNGNGRSDGGSVMVGSLSELCDRSHAGSSEDFLLLSAWYLTRFEKLDKFSLKRINSMLVKSGLTPVNHSVLESTLTRGYLSMVPDLTGTADVSEYTLTDEGQSAATRLF